MWDRDTTITESEEASEPAFDKAEALKQVETFLFRDIETGDEKDMDCSVDPTLWTMAAVGALQDDEKKAEVEGIKPRRVISKARKEKEELLSSFLQARRKALDELHACADFAPGQVAPREHQELGWASAGSRSVFGTRPPRGERRPLTESMKVGCVSGAISMVEQSRQTWPLKSRRRGGEQKSGRIRPDSSDPAVGFCVPEPAQGQWWAFSARDRDIRPRRAKGRGSHRCSRSNIAELL